MEPTEFNGLFKDLITHLYDYTVLETHPLTKVVALPEDYGGSRGEYLRAVTLAEIERFKPEGEESFHAVEWRSYHILQQRYVEGISLGELAQKLSLSSRQLRRDNSRTLQALTGRVWDKLFGDAVEPAGETGSDEDQAFESDFEILDLNEVVSGIEGMLAKRVAVDGFKLTLILDESPLQVLADRIVVRQILISMVGYFLNLPCDLDIALSTASTEKMAQVTLHSQLTETWCLDEEKDHADLLESARYWSGQMKGEIEIVHPPYDEFGQVELIFRLPQVQQHIILVVDDQQPTQQMFRRFLSRTAYQVIGTTDPSEAISLAHQLQPSLITLDVMMPKVDGWEILQALKTDTETREIPVLVCSAWVEPELAQSLGAAGFLKKPVRQRDLLTALEDLDL